MGLGTCKYCGKQVKWIETSRGKNMPCNPAPRAYVEEQGGPDKVVTAKGAVLRCRLVPLDKNTPVGFVPHWGECRGKGRGRRDE